VRGELPEPAKQYRADQPVPVIRQNSKQPVRKLVLMKMRTAAELQAFHF
jgi:hypothetical protein